MSPEEKALWLYESGRVYVRGHRALVAGEHGWHRVEATELDVECDCLAAQHGNTCSHILAAMIAWGHIEEAPW